MNQLKKKTINCDNMCNSDLVFVFSHGNNLLVPNHSGTGGYRDGVLRTVDLRQRHVFVRSGDLEYHTGIWGGKTARHKNRNKHITQEKSSERKCSRHS